MSFFFRFADFFAEFACGIFDDWRDFGGLSGKEQPVQAFVQTEAEEDLFFLMFAHGYEFDFGTKESDPDARLAVEAGTAHFYKGKATAL